MVASVERDVWPANPLGSSCMQVPMVDTSVGRLFAMLHAVLAQAFVCTLLATALACSRGWIERSAGLHSVPSARLRKLGRWVVGLFFVQLSIAAIVRHSFAGLAIPTFPASATDGSWLAKRGGGCSN